MIRPHDVQTIAAWAEADCVGDDTVRIQYFCIDSRAMQQHALFIALPGRFTDGHAYLASTLSAPNTVALIRRGYYQEHRDTVHRLLAPHRRALLVVPDPLAALLRIAQHYLATLALPCIIAITGSSGKTTTKELLAGMIGQSNDVWYTAANRNSAIGVPLAVLGIERPVQYAIFEVGTGYRGEIPALATVLSPHIVIVTNVGHAHIEAFGTQGAIAQEKLALALQSAALQALYLHSRARRFICRCLLLSLARFRRPPVSLFARRRALLPARGRVPSPRFCYYDRDPFARAIAYTAADSGARVVIGDQVIESELTGAVQYENIQAAVAVAHQLGVSNTDIAAGIAAYRPLFGRMQVLRAPISIILDCYNANPESTASALDHLRRSNCTGRKICILGAMKELGMHSNHLHTDIFLQALQMKFDYLFCIGAEFSHLDFTMQPTAYYFGTVDDAMAQVLALVRPGDLLLLKGSRSIQLERLAAQIQSRERVG